MVVWYSGTQLHKNHCPLMHEIRYVFVDLKRCHLPDAATHNQIVACLTLRAHSSVLGDALRSKKEPIIWCTGDHYSGILRECYRDIRRYRGIPQRGNFKKSRFFIYRAENRETPRLAVFMRVYSGFSKKKKKIAIKPLTWRMFCCDIYYESRTSTGSFEHKYI